MPGNTGDKASPGQPFKPPRAEVWNGMVDAGNAYRAGRLSTGTPQPTRPRETDIIKVKNTSGAARKRGEIVRISGKSVTDLSDEHVWLGGVAVTADGYFGILKEPIENNDVGRVQVSGCCIATVAVSDATHTRAAAAAASYKLASGDDGPIEILYAPSGTGDLECVVRFGGGSGGGGGGDVLYIFVMSSDMVAKQASSDFYRLDGASRGADLPGSTLYDPEGVFAGLKINATGYCIKQGDKYYIIQANCQDEIV